MRDLRRGKMLVIGLAPALILFGCASTPLTPTPPPLKEEVQVGRINGTEQRRVDREKQMQAAWKGRPYHTLVEAFGAPHAIMSLPAYRPLRTDVILYEITDKASNCIDAFTVVVPGNSAERVVADYFCR